MNQIRIPKLRRHRRKGLPDRAYFEVAGRRHYVGLWGTQDADSAYKQRIAEYLASGTFEVPTDDLTVAEMCLRFLQHAEGYYVHRDGTPTGEIGWFKAAIGSLVRTYDVMPVSKFKAMHLAAVRASMVADGLARTTINGRIRRIKTMFKWATFADLCPGSVLHSLASVSGLKAGRTSAKEAPPVGPVPDAHVYALQDHLAPNVWAMVMTQRLTGARPGEVTAMRACDITMDGDCWEYSPAAHKNSHRGKARVVMIGPRAQEYIRPFLGTDVTAYLFRPEQALQHRYGKPVTRKLAPRYDKNSYAHAIRRACQRAGIPAWGPNRLRHSYATEVRRLAGLEASRVLLGHSGIESTLLYAEADQQLARRVALQVG